MKKSILLQVLEKQNLQFLTENSSVHLFFYSKLYKTCAAEKIQLSRINDTKVSFQ